MTMRMRSIQALCFLMVLIMVKKTTCSTKNLKLTHFQAMIAQKQAISPAPQSSPPDISIKREGRVFYPIGYGADPTGKQDSSDAILQALNDAFHVQSGLVLLPGVNDLGGIEIDLQGGDYRIGKPLRFPPGANVLVSISPFLNNNYFGMLRASWQCLWTGLSLLFSFPFFDIGDGTFEPQVKGGTLRATGTFPGDRYLIELWSPDSRPLFQTNGNLTGRKDFNRDRIRYEDITFRDILFDSSFRAGGIFIIDSARIRIDNCMFIRFLTEGIRVKRGHETYISSSFLGQHLTVGSDPDEKDCSGTAIDLDGNDNAVTDVAIFSAAIGILLKGQANIITGAHCYNKATYWGGIGILVKSTPGSSSLTRIDNCYLDFTAIVMEDPFQVHVTNGLFLGDANVVIKSVRGTISGLNIVDNMFTSESHKGVPIVRLDGNFSSIDQVVIDRNNAIGMSLKSTVGRLTVAGNGTKWVADFSPVLVFPSKINHLHYSFYIQGGVPSSFPRHAATTVSNNVVVVESNVQVNGVVSMVVDQYNMIGEKSAFL
ncbi:hypothetical protein SLEP1_g44221 [Rubroshorea leprosula]|uniref:Polygalacturonase n=1 Tax=Rubroshorea leprosula TaxID=152421 RepID=A0AAV5LHB5_9ROSI|nr:hypothetical protein SLEP1_g44221 [Rubroshorea leprosula]